MRKRNNPLSKKSGAAAAAMMLLGVIPLAAAQEKVAVGLEEVLVTARKRAENIQDVPIPITAFSGENLREMGFRNIGNISAQAPNLQINRDTGGGSGMVACMRGLCRSDTILTEDPLVGVYIDGFYVPKAEGSLFDMMDVQSVEVLRGPQGTLFGKNTLAGAINVTSKAPSGVFGGAVDVDLGNENLRSGRVSVDLPLVADMLATKLSYLRTKRDGFIEDTAGRDMKDIDNQSARASFRLTPTADLTVDYVVDWYKARQGLDIYQATYVEPGVDLILPGITSTASDKMLKKRTTIAPGGYDDLDMHFNGLTVAWNLSPDLTLKSLTGYRSADGDTLRVWSPFVLVAGLQQMEQKFFSQEFQALGSAWDERLQYVAGLFYSRETGSFQQQLGFGSLSNGTMIDLDIKNESYAVFGELTYDITEQFSITGGARYTSEKREADLLNKSMDGSIVLENISALAPTNKIDTTALAPRLSLQYRPFDGVMAFFTYARGFKSGGLNGRANTAAEFTPYDDSEMDSFELGLKSQWWDRRLQVNLTYFHEIVDDLQIQLNSFDSGSGAFLTKIENAGKAKIQGVEFEGSVFLTDSLQLNGTVGYIDPEYKTFLALSTDPANPGLINVAHQRNFQFTPEWTYNVSLRYKRELAALGSIVAWVGYSFVDDMNFQVVPSSRVAGDSYALLDARLEWSGLGGDGGISVALWGKNLTDEEYRTGGFDIPTLGLPGGNDGIGFNTYGDPKSYGVTVRYQWGAH